MSSDCPLVSVLMPVYNGERHLREAVDSILAQTFADFEFIIINDGSTDDTETIIRSYDDPRIRLTTQTNHGVVYSRNRGIALARGSYIAPMDSDDISAPARLATEVELLSSHPTVAVVGTSIIRINTAGRELRTDYYLAHDPELRQDLTVRCPFAHGSTMMRADLVRKVGGYRQEFWVAEDYDLWRRLAAVGELANILEPLYLYRENAQGLTASHERSMSDFAMRISGELLDDPNYQKDIPLRRCLASYERLPRGPRAAVIARILENYFRILVACARRGEFLVALYRFVKLMSSGTAGLEFATKRLANRLGIDVSPSSRRLQA